MDEEPMKYDPSAPPFWASSKPPKAVVRKAFGAALLRRAQYDAIDAGGKSLVVGANRAVRVGGDLGDGNKRVGVRRGPA
jgi:hypothetical protein